jgi:TniQ
VHCVEDAPRRRWPLHPRPFPYETLAWYVRRLADQYGVGYGTFCLRALGIPVADGEARSFGRPAPEVLWRLSTGTGMPVERLEQMTLAHLWQRLSKELDACMATAEGRAWVEQVTGTLLSRNS